mgnify:CR=1 FL=1
MSQHTFCRARPLKQEPCSALAALKIVQDMLVAGTSNLADDVRANLHNVEVQLQVVQGFPEDLSDGRPAAAPRGADGGAAAGPGSKKESKKDKKTKEGGVTPAAAKEMKDKGKEKKEKKGKEDKKKEKKRRAEDAEGGEEKKMKKQKTEK